MHFIGSSCTTFSSSASFFPGERVGTMQLGSPRRTRPSVSVASLLVPRVYKPPSPHLRCISSSWSWSSPGDRHGVARIQSLRNTAPRSRTFLVASTRAFLPGLRKTRHYPCEIETPPRFPPRVVLRKRHWEGAWEDRACFRAKS